MTFTSATVPAFIGEPTGERTGFWQMLLDNIDCGACLLQCELDAAERLDFRFLEANQAFETLASLGPVRGGSMRDLLPNLEEDWHELLAEVLLTGKPARVLKRSRTFGDRWLDLRASRIGKHGKRQLGLILTDVAVQHSSAQVPCNEAVRLQSTLDAAGMGTFVWHVAEDRTEADTRSLQLCGLEPGSTLRFPDELASFLHPDDRAGYAAHIASLLDPSSTGTPWGEFRMMSPSDSPRWLGIVARARFEKGRAVRVLGALTDITPRKMIEKALRESEERFRGFAENSADTLWIADARGQRLEYLSPTYERTFGETRDQIMTDIRHWGSLVHPEDRADAGSYMARALQGETAIANYRVIRPVDGAQRWLRDTGFPIRDAQGTIVRVAGIVQDCTEQTLTARALLEEKDRFHTLAEGIPQLVWRSQGAGRWTWASRQWLDYTGQTQEQSHDIGWLDAIHPDDRAASMAAWDEAEAVGQLNVEHRIWQASCKEWRWHQTHSMPLRETLEPGHSHNPIIEWIGASSNIERLKRLQEQQEVLVTELQHRTRNLLSITRNIARRSFGPSREREEYDARLAALGRVQNLLSCIPTWSVPLVELVHAELEATGSLEAHRATAIGPMVSFSGDKVQNIALVLHELATNALKYGAFSVPAGHLEVRWQITGQSPDQYLTIDWLESGVPMPPGQPRRRGFGSELIERVLPYQLDAEAQLRFTSDGAHCHIVLPSESFQAEEDKHPIGGSL